MYDKLVTLLNRLGYQPIFLAETNVTPVDVYNFTDDRRLVRRGPFADYQPDVDLEPSSGRRPDIVHTETSSKKMSGATSFLKAALQAIGVRGNLEIDLGFASGSDLRFSFEDVTYRRVNPSRIDATIEDSGFRGIPEAYLDAGRLHLVYEYLYSSALLMRKADHSKFDASAEAALQGLGDASVGASIDRQRMTEVRFEGESPAAFAYKAGRLERSSGRWYFYPEEVVFRKIAPREGALALTAEPFAADTVPFSHELERVLPLVTRDLVPERRPFLPAEGMVLMVEDGSDEHDGDSVAPRAPGGHRP
jgi:hypothetical protein